MSKRRSKKKFQKKRKRINNSKIYISDWLQYKPYNIHSDYDVYYVGIANKVLKILTDYREVIDDNLEYKLDTRKAIAIHLTSFFEDIVSEIGVWASFKKLNKQLYGFEIPLFEVDEYKGEEGITPYEEEEISYYDVAFLLWYYLSFFHEMTYNPEYMGIGDIAGSVAYLFEQELEDAPISDYYDGFYKVNATDDYFEIREKADDFLNTNFLIFFEYKNLVMTQLQDIEAKTNDPYQLNAMSILLLEEARYTKRYSLNALKGIELFAMVADCDEETKEKIRNIAHRLDGEFTYIGDNEDYKVFKHCDTNRELKIKTSSFGENHHLHEIGHVVFGTFIHWNNEYLQSGILSSVGKRRTSIGENYSFYAHTEEYQQKLFQQVDDMWKAFKMATGHDFIYQVENKKDLEEIYLRFWSNYYDIAVKDSELTEKEIHHQIEEGGREFLNQFKPGAALIFRKGEGILLQPNFQSVINLLEKPRLSLENTNELYDMLMSFNPDLVAYTLAHYPTHNFKFPVQGCNLNMVKHWKFLQRYETPHFYNEILPSITLMMD